MMIGRTLRLLVAVLLAGAMTNLVAVAGTETYVYDALGRLISVTLPSGAQTAYSYDAAGNRTTVSAGAPPPPLTTPGTPSGYSPTHGLLYISWGVTTGGSPPYLYYLESCQGSTCTNFSLQKTSSAANTTVTGLFYPATYRFRVRARDLNGAGNYSAYSGIFTILIN